MVSLWPWKGEASAADFEKLLAALATKIQKTNAKHDRLRQSSRRVKVMWTLYSSFAYILAALILTLVTGWKNWGVLEFIVVLGGPFVVYGVRRALTTYYDYRISSTQNHLENLYKERDDTIEKLKTATKYNSTQQLLEKYGSPKPSPKQASPSGGKRKSTGGQQQQQQQQQPQRTNLPPPPTANIQRPRPGPPSQPSQPSTPQMVNAPGAPPPGLANPLPPPPPGAEFAPNAFSATSTYSAEPQWYDRLFDALLGEDESSARNRIVLICQQCRLVNGQAPPGTKNLDDLGRWRCGGCGAENGAENETAKIVEQIKEQEKKQGKQDEQGVSGVEETPEKQDLDEEVDTANDGAEDQKAENENSEDSSVELVEMSEGIPPAKSTRSKARQRKKYEWNKDML